MTALCDFLTRELGNKYSFSVHYNIENFTPYIKIVLNEGNIAKYSIHYIHDEWNRRQIYHIKDFNTNERLEVLIGNA